MPYKSKSDLPENVRNVLQENFIEAYYSASDQYDEPEERRGDGTPCCQGSRQKQVWKR